MALTCGENGSTASEVFDAINNLQPLDILHKIGSGLANEAYDKIEMDTLLLNKANVNGDNTKTFKVLSAVNNDEALNKGQLIAEMKAVDGTGSGLDADLVQGVTKNLLGIGGDGYAWVDETANRAVGVTYTNTTGRPIMVSIGASITGTAAFEERLYIDGVVVVNVNQSGGHDLRISPMVAIVPAGSTYTYVEITTTADIGYWAELK